MYTRTFRSLPQLLFFWNQTKTPSARFPFRNNNK
jgi:hypothetical protein